MRRSCFVFIFFILLSTTGETKDCIDWAQVFSKEKVRSIPATHLIFSVDPFRNDTDQKGDDWIANGLQHLLIRYLNTDSGIAAIPSKLVPFLAPPKEVRYQVGGLFQHTQNWLRIFIQLKDPKGEILAQFPVETPFPLHKRFFEGLREAVEKIFKKLERSSINATVLKSIQNETSNVHAFENFIKGRLAYESYDPNKIEVALIWFQEARREDYKYVAAYQGLIAAYEFSSLQAKQKGENYQQHLEAIEKTLQERNRWSAQKMEPTANRFLKAHIHYVSGNRALTKNNFSKAAQELRQAADLVPEDAMTAYALAESYAKLGNARQADFYRERAREINSCLKAK